MFINEKEGRKDIKRIKYKGKSYRVVNSESQDYNIEKMKRIYRKEVLKMIENKSDCEIKLLGFECKKCGRLLGVEAFYYKIVRTEKFKCNCNSSNFEIHYLICQK